MTARDINPVRSVAAFFVGSIAISWACWLPVIGADFGLFDLPGSTEELLVIVGGFGPLFSALAMAGRTSGRAGVVALLGQALRWRVPLRWYAAVLVVPVALRFLVISVHVLGGGSFSGPGDLERWLAVPSTFVMVLILGGPLGEEFGWRGYSQPRLQPGLGILKASLVVGLASSLWHLPLFLIPSTPQSHLPLALFILRTTALSVISGWIWNRSGRGLLLVLLFHASLNTWPNTLFILEAQNSAGPYLASTMLYLGWALLLLLLHQLTPDKSALKERRETAEAAA